MDFEEIEFYDVIAETDKSWLLDLGDGEQVWFPKSECEIATQYTGGGGEILVPLWLAEKKGLV